MPENSKNLVTKYSDKVDELFKQESKKTLLTNTDYDWSGAHTVNVWKVNTAEMQDYKRNIIGDEEAETFSRFGTLKDLSTQIEEMMLKKDRSFIFNIDMLDEDETNNTVSAGKALARQIRERVVPEVDSYTYNVMVNGAGTSVNGDLTPENIYNEILKGSEVLDNAEVPETERVLLVVPEVYTMLKQSTAFDKTEIGAQAKLLGVVAMLDGMQVVKVAASKLPENFGFMLVHPSATVAPTKLEDYATHPHTPISSGTIVTGRVVYDAFVLDNKKMGIYYHSLTLPVEEETQE